MTEQSNDTNHDSSVPQGPVADAVVAARMELLVAALLGDEQDDHGRPVNWSGKDERTIPFDAIEKVLAASVTPARPTQDAQDAYLNTAQGS